MEQSSPSSSYNHPMFARDYVPEVNPSKTSLPQGGFNQISDNSVYNHFSEYGYHPLNAKLAVPAPLPAIGSSPAAQQHEMMYGRSPPQNEMGAPLSDVFGRNKMIPVRLPNGMTMQVPSDELASMPNALPNLNLPSAPFLSDHGVGDMGASGQWRNRLAQVQNNIASQQAQFTQYSNLASETMLGKEQESNRLQERLQSLQRSLVEAKKAAETQKEYLEQVARRNAALEVDKHRVQAEAQLAGITLEYQKVKAEADKLRQEMLKVAASKEGLMKQAYAFRSVVRSDTNAIEKLMKGGDKSSAEDSKERLAEDAKDKKAEASESASVDKSRLAFKKVEEANAEDLKATDTALEHMESPAFEVPAGGAGASGAAGGASGPAL
jgi:hypothetical protein